MLKRLFDIWASALACLFFLPLFLIILLLVKMDSKGPIFHRAARLGKYGKSFKILKFRTMAADAASRGPGITRQGDPRITRIGYFLRSSKLDELPQLFNILKGEMSFVGPRPEDPRYVVHYTPEQRRLLSVRPGIASPAIIKYRHEEKILAAAGNDPEKTYLEVVLPDKLRIDLEYIEKQSFCYDLKILIQTLFSVFLPPKD